MIGIENVWIKNAIVLKVSKRTKTQKFVKNFQKSALITVIVKAMEMVMRSVLIKYVNVCLTINGIQLMKHVLILTAILIAIVKAMIKTEFVATVNAFVIQILLKIIITNYALK
jgi:hypothetical protein